LLLIKNPAGFTQVVETFLVHGSGLRLMMAVNDLDADGRDVSWLWDVPLEVLAAHKPTVVTAGIRGADMALRLHYAEVESEAAGTFEEGVKRLLELTSPGETAYILPTYTAMLQVRDVLSKLTQIPEAGE
jgi:UDP-N-acetylmuramyl tripeptide synthase